MVILDYVTLIGLGISIILLVGAIARLQSRVRTLEDIQMRCLMRLESDIRKEEDKYEKT